MILSHMPGCHCLGVTKIKGNRTDTRPEGDGGREDRTQWRFRPTEQTKRGYSDEGGQETVESWQCVEGCPVAALDAQSGERPGMSGGGTKGAGFRNKYVSGGKHDKILPAMAYGDTGGASRFFKLVAGSK